jgi:hypothetical protein
MTTGDHEMEHRLDIIESRVAIADLVHQYAFNIRSARASDCLVLFTEDATFETREARMAAQDDYVTRSVLAGRSAIIDYISPNGGMVCPVIHNLLIDVRGNEAESTCVMFNADTHGPAVLGQYRDTFKREGQWQFSSRVFTMFVH